LPTRSFGVVDFKVAEAEYFLGRIRVVSERHEWHPLQFYLSAFAAATRSVTFAMQAALTDHPGFAEWYAPRQSALKSDPRARFFHEFRTASQHLGESPLSGGEFSASGSRYYFAAPSNGGAAIEEDVVSACEEYFKTILRLVYDCYVELAPIVNAQWRFTKEHFSSLGLTIADAEVEMGLPPGWTDAGELTEDARWRLLRCEADGCGISDHFQSWLSLSLPHPDDGAE